MVQPAKNVSKVFRYLELIMLGLVLLYFGRTLFVPLLFGLLTAMVMCPVCRWLERKAFGRTAAVTTCLLIVTVLIAALAVLFIWQLKLFSKDAPSIFQKTSIFFHSVQDQVADRFGITIVQNNWGNDISARFINTMSTVFNTASSTMFMLFMIPVFTALFLYHRQVFVQVLRAIIPGEYVRKLDEILNQTIHTYFNYIKGMVLVYIIVGILNSIGLLALGVRHAVLFGMLCAVMTIIPYLGIIISALLPISVIWMDTGNVWYPLGVVGVFTFVQYLEANIIFPKVVGTQLNVSTFAILIAIIAGGIVWGVSGMILFIPFVAILKIISDNIEELMPLNILLRRE